MKPAAGRASDVKQSAMATSFANQQGKVEQRWADACMPSY
jgi:hypothetical protein